MEESNQQQQHNQLFLQMQQQQQLQQRQQQLFLMQQLQRQQQQQQQSAMFPTNLRPPGLTQNRPVNPFLQNPNPNPSPFHHQNQNVPSQQQQMMMMQNQQQKSMRPSNQLELQCAYQDAWRVCHPDFKRPFASLEDACERLLPYHVVADYEAEEDDRILEADTGSGTPLSRSQLWDNNIAEKVAEFSAAFEKQVEAFNMITQKKKDGELRSEERLAIEQMLLQDERRACLEVKTELDREAKAQEARLRMAALAQAGQVKPESQFDLMARNPLRANAVGNYGEQRQSMNPNEMMMMMMNGWGNQNNNNANLQREEKEPLEDFLNDDGGTGEHGNWRGNGEFDLNSR